MEPLYTYSWPGYLFEVYQNRIQIREGFGGIMKGFQKERTILLRNVTDVSMKKMNGTVIINMADGKTYEHTFGLKAEEVRNAILNAL